MNDNITLVTLNDYQNLAGRTDKGSPIAYYILGLIGEAGEVANIYKRAVRKGDDMTLQERMDYHTQILDELGDILWYVAMTAHHLGHDLSSIAEMNIEKLQLRYRNANGTFSEDLADLHRQSKNNGER